MSNIVEKTDLLSGLIEDIEILRIKLPKIPLRSQFTNIEQLAQSINERGLLQPIVVRGGIANSFEIVAGNRRFNACKLLGWRQIPCHIVELDDKEAFEISLVENIQRDTLNPIEEAEAFKKYVSGFGWGGASDLAKKIGKSAAYVARRIKLLDLPENILELIDKSIITKSLAQELCVVRDKSEQSKLGELISKRHLSFRKVRKLIRDANEQPDTRCFQSNDKVPEVIKYKRAFDKAIILTRSSMVKLASTIDSVEDNWVVHEILIRHKNLLHEEIDLFLKQKKRLVMDHIA